jgi:hypothetical protein
MRHWRSNTARRAPARYDFAFTDAAGREQPLTYLEPNILINSRMHPDTNNRLALP